MVWFLLLDQSQPNQLVKLHRDCDSQSQGSQRAIKNNWIKLECAWGWGWGTGETGWLSEVPVVQYLPYPPMS